MLLGSGFSGTIEGCSRLERARGRSSELLSGLGCPQNGIGRIVNLPESHA
jgi:hypothetical protein